MHNNKMAWVVVQLGVLFLFPALIFSKTHPGIPKSFGSETMYFIRDHRMTWPNAREYCQNHSSNLAFPTDKDMLGFFKSIAVSEGSPFRQGQSGILFIDGNRKDPTCENKPTCYLSEDKKTIAPDMWSPRPFNQPEPSYKHDMCLAVDKGGVIDLPYEEALPFLCRITPKPPSSAFTFRPLLTLVFMTKLYLSLSA